MPNIQSAKKAIRVSGRKRALNDSRRFTMRTTIKNVAKSVSPESVAVAYQAIDKALKRGVIKKNTAARKKSRLAKMLSAKAR